MQVYQAFGYATGIKFITRRKKTSNNKICLLTWVPLHKCTGIRMNQTICQMEKQKTNDGKGQTAVTMITSKETR